MNECLLWLTAITAGRYGLVVRWDAIQQFQDKDKHLTETSDYFNMT